MICDSIEAVVNAGQKVCKNRWSASNNLLTYLSLPILEPLYEAICPKVHLEEVEKQFDHSKEWIQQISQLTVQEMEKWIEVPHASIARIKLFIKEWKKMTSVEILSQICKNDIQLRNSHFSGI